MTRHPLTTTITLLIMAEPQSKRLEDNVYQVLSHLIDLAEWSDERRADLYARLAERLKPDMTMLIMERVVEYCLIRNEEWFLDI